MKQPLMLLPTALTPAQAEALYDVVLNGAPSRRSFAGDAGSWPGDDGEEEVQTSSVIPPSPRAIVPAAKSSTRL